VTGHSCTGLSDDTSSNAASKRSRVPEAQQRSHHAAIRVYDDAGNVIETHQHKGDFKPW